MEEVTQSIKDVPPKTLVGYEYTKGDTIRGTEILRNAVRQFNKPKGAKVGTDRYVIFAVAYQKVRVDFVVRFRRGTVHLHGARASPDRGRRRSSVAPASTRERLVLPRVGTSLTARS